MFRNLIFDWSGTLVDDLGPVIEATNAVIGNYDLPPYDRERFRRHFRLPYLEFYDEILPGVSLPELEQHFRPAFAAAESKVFVLPHAREALEAAQARGIRMFVLSSMDSDAFNRQAAEFGMEHFFEETYASVLDKREVIHKILQRHGLDKAETAFVGDMTHDIETARHGEVSSIAVLTGYHHAEVLAEVRPDLTLPDLSILPKILGEKSKTRPVSTVGALVHDGAGKILLIKTHKWSDLWGIPGGKIERGESSEDALRREMLEETALTIHDIEFVMVQDCIDSPEFIRPEHFILLNYIARAENHDVTLNEEAEEFEWVELNDAFDFPLNAATQVLLQKIQNENLLNR